MAGKYVKVVHKTVNGITDGIEDIYARIFDPITGQFVTDEINLTNAQENKYLEGLEATAGGGFVVNIGHEGVQSAVVGADGTVNLVNQFFGFQTNVSDLVWTSPDNLGVSLVINDTKPTDNHGNPSYINGYNFVTLADGTIAVAWGAATLKTVNGITDGIEDIYARIFDPITGQFVTDEINLTNAQENKYLEGLEATAGGVRSKHWA